MLKDLFANIIKIYQRTLSPDTGFMKIFFPYGACRYYPTCSEYGRQSVQEHGAIKGSGYAIRRVLCCNPLAKGGYDPIIKKTSLVPTDQPNLNKGK